MATYYVRIDVYWQNSADRFVGPFSSRDEAQAAIDHATQNGNAVMSYQTAGDVRNSIRIYGVLSKTEAKRAGMKAGSWFGEGNMIDRIPSNTDELSRIESY